MIFLILTIYLVYKDYKENKFSKKTFIFVSASLIFAILTFIGGYLVITHKLDNAGYSVIPMLFTLIFSILYRNSKKEENNKSGVNYLFWQEGYAGGLTPLLDRNGNVVVDRVDN